MIFWFSELKSLTSNHYFLEGNVWCWPMLMGLLSSFNPQNMRGQWKFTKYFYLNQNFIWNEVLKLITVYTRWTKNLNLIIIIHCKLTICTIMQLVVSVLVVCNPNRGSFVRDFLKETFPYRWVGRNESLASMLSRYYSTFFFSFGAILWAEPRYTYCWRRRIDD